MDPRGTAPGFQDGACRRLCGTPLVPAVRLIHAEHHQPCVELVGHVLPGPRQGMDPMEVAGTAQIGAQPGAERLRHLVGVALQQLGAVLGQLGDGRLGRVPVPRAVLIEVGRRAGQPPQRIAEHGGRLARHHAPELHTSVLQPLMSSLGGGRGTEIDGPRDAPASGELAEVRHVSVDPQRQRAGTVHVLLDHRHPVVRQVSGQLELHARIVDRDVRGQDQRIPVALLPKAVNHGRHQPQHAPRALELHQRRPVRVQAVEDLRMYRPGRLDPLLVVRVPTRGRELLALGPIEVRERPRDHVPVPELRGVRERLEQPSPHDLEAFLGARRPPGRLDPPDHVAQPVERLASALSADLDVIGPGVGRPGRIRGWQADDEQAVVGEPGRFGQHLRKAELGLEAAGREVALVVQLAGVGDPLVDEDQAGTVFPEELAQHVAGAACGVPRDRSPRCSGSRATPP